MFQVATFNLSSDARSASTQLGPGAIGELDAKAVEALLETFRKLNPLQNDEAEPQLILTGRGGKFIVRTGHGKLLVYNARDPNEPYAELKPSEIIEALSRPSAASDEAFGSAYEAVPVRSSNRGIAVAILTVGLALNGFTLYAAFYIDDVNAAPSVVLITDEAEIARHRNALVGTFSTGSDSGDRGIVLEPDGVVKFLEFGARGKVLSSIADRYRIGRLDQKLCLATQEGGIIEISSADSIVYYRDTYRRVR